MSAHRTSLTVIAAVAALCALVPFPVLAQQCGPEALTSFGTWFSPSTAALQASNRNEKVVPDITLRTSSMRLLLGVTAGTDRGFNVVVRDYSNRVLATFGARDFLDELGRLQRRWTGRLPVERASVDLVAAPNTDIRVEVLSAISYAGESSDTRLFSIVSKEGEPWRELHEKKTFEMAERAGDTVGMVVAASINNDGVKQSWCCSGVMLSADVMMTNWHCGGSRALQMTDKDYWRSDVCENTVVDLGWAKGASSRQYGCSAVLAKDRPLDFALIRLRPIIGVGAGTGTPVRARLSKQAVTARQDIFIVHHAKCSEKLVSSSCQVQDPSYRAWQTPSRPQDAKSDFTHSCNTEQGASGAPVFGLDGELVGLHHVGVDRDAQCNRLDEVNKAVGIQRIRQYLRDEHEDVAAELWPD